ncbi:MAG: hypothetical protein KDA58_09535 [Planctomycetaceae bacterium]|nr:hypothetical protein [Planctomycetaceae bacterium]
MSKVRNIPANGLQRVMLLWENERPVNATHAYTFPANFPVSYEEFREVAVYILSQACLAHVTATVDRLELRYSGATDEIPIERIQYHGNIAEAFQGLACEQLQTPFAKEGCPLRFVWLEPEVPGTQATGLLTCYRHAVADGATVMQVLRQILARAVGLPAQTPLELFDGDLTRECRKLGLTAWSRFRSAASELWEFARCRAFPRPLQGQGRPIAMTHSQQISVAAALLTARSLGVTINDLVSSALMEGLMQLFPGRSWNPMATRIAIQCSVDLHVPLGLSPHVVGQLLGSYQLRCKHSSAASFEQQTLWVGKESRRMKQHRTAVLQPHGMNLSFRSIQLLPQPMGLDLQKFCMPIWGGVSNIDARGLFMDLPANCQLMDCRRFTDVGELIPIYVAVTSVNDRISLATTFREGILSEREVHALMNGICRRMNSHSDSRLQRQHDRKEVISVTGIR